MRRRRPIRSLLLFHLLFLFPILCSCLLVPATFAHAQEQGATLMLVWAANHEQDLRGYRVYEGDASGNPVASVQEILVEDIPRGDRIEGIVTFEVSDVGPGYHCWVVTAFDEQMNESLPSRPACISLGTQPSPIHLVDFHEDGFYGSWPGAAVSYDQSVVYTFDGRPGEQLLVCRLWDVDSPTEVEILVNGNSLGYADTTGKYTCSPLLTTRIPPEYLEEAALNTLVFEWNSDGGKDMWAVGSVEIVELIPLPASGFYGNLANVHSGDRSHPRTVGFMFQGEPGAAFLLYETYDVDFKGEIEIYLNGKRVGQVDTVGNNAYLSGVPLRLADSLVLDHGVNTLVFSNVLNPPYSLIWGVGNVRVP